MSRKKAAAVQAQSPVVYCGPTIAGTARQFTVYTNGIPQALEKKAAEIPVILALIVPLEQLPEVRERLRSGTGAAYTLYRQVQKIIKGGK